MLFLLFQLGQDRYALEAAQVVEVLPLVAFKRVPGAPRGISGLVDYRGTVIPVLDLSMVALGVPAAARVSTRLLIVRCTPPAGTARLLGLIAERATETMKCSPEDFRATGVDNRATPFLGPVIRDAHGLVQRVEVAGLLSGELGAALFPEDAVIDS